MNKHGLVLREPNLFLQIPQIDSSILRKVRGEVVDEPNTSPLGFDYTWDLSKQVFCSFLSANKNAHDIRPHTTGAGDYV